MTCHMVLSTVPEGLAVHKLSKRPLSFCIHLSVSECVSCAALRRLSQHNRRLCSLCCSCVLDAFNFSLRFWINSGMIFDSCRKILSISMTLLIPVVYLNLHQRGRTKQDQRFDPLFHNRLRSFRFNSSSGRKSKGFCKRSWHPV